ncbi:hypothetical protein D9M68_768340 [compost metagenome]
MGALQVVSALVLVLFARFSLALKALASPLSCPRTWRVSGSLLVAAGTKEILAEVMVAPRGTATF